MIPQLPHLDIPRVQDVGLAGVEDPLILEWAERERRVLLTHDRDTMPEHAHARLAAGLRIAGVCVVSQSLPLGRAINEPVLIAECTREEEWENLVRFVPLCPPGWHAAGIPGYL